MLLWKAGDQVREGEWVDYVDMEGRNAEEWSYQVRLKYGWIPSDPTSTEYQLRSGLWSIPLSMM